MHFYFSSFEPHSLGLDASPGRFPTPGLLSQGPNLRTAHPVRRREADGP